MNLTDQIIEKVKEVLEHDTTGHDWFHIERVYKMALFLQEKEGGNREVIALAALLHDISDHKFNGGDLLAGGNIAYELLLEYGASEALAIAVKEIVNGVSYKGANVPDSMRTLEGKIVQDADRLDAIGAIGIGRAFAYGGAKDRPMYVPEHQAMLHETFEDYASSKSHTINHFYEKLLLLKDRMHTETAREIAVKRHAFMELFLQEFYAEWNSKIRIEK